MKYPLLAAAVFIFLASIVSNAQALPTIEEIQTQVETGNYIQAETLVRQVLAEKPNSAKAHYQLGQILEMENDYQAAYTELTAAASLDRSLSFASNPAKFRLALTKAQVNTGRADAPEVSNGTHVGRDLAFGALVLVLTIFAFFATITIMKRRDENEDEEDQKTKLTEQTSKLTDLLDQISGVSIKLALDTSDGATIKKSSLDTLKSDVTTALTKVKKDRQLLSYSSIQRFQDSLDQLVNGKVTYYSSRKYLDPEPELKSHEFRATGPTPSVSAVRMPYSPPMATPSSNTTVVNNTSSNTSDMVTGMMLGEMMSRPSVERETIVERPVEREEEEKETPREFDTPSDDTIDDNDRDRFDSGSNDSFDSGSSSDLDSGSSDSFDSGSSSGDSSEW